MTAYTNIYRPITAAAIQVAERNADKAQAAGYYVTTATMPGNYIVRKNKNEFYVCQTTIGTRGVCGCEQFKNVNFCKHLVLCERYIGWEENNIAEGDDYADNEADRFFMMECQAEVLAEVEGAWF